MSLLSAGSGRGGSEGSGEDLEAALMALTYKRKTDKTERTKDLKDMIMERFDNNMAAFVEWSQSLHTEVHQ